MKPWSRSGLLALVTVVSAALVSCPRRTFADTVVLTDGQVIEGDVTLDGEFYVIKGRYGTTTRVLRQDVREIRKGETATERFQRRLKDLEASDKNTSPAAWVELGVLAKADNLAVEARKCFEKALELDPDYEAAHKGLGHVRYDGQWVPEEEAMAMKGMVRMGGRWVTKEEADAATAAAAAGGQGAGAGGAGGAGGGTSSLVGMGGPDWQICPTCNGTKFEHWFPCNQCKRSSKPGYLYFGDTFMVCNRCYGTAKMPGISCRNCGGVGKIDPAKPKPSTERVIPKGFVACPTCNGTGVEIWLPCHQCKRSGFPGYIYTGERFQPCLKCGITGKVAGLKCIKCQGSGLLPETK